MNDRKACYGNIPMKTNKRECEKCSLVSECVRKSLERDVKKRIE